MVFLILSLEITVFVVKKDKDEDGFLSLEEFKSAIKKESMKEQADKWFKNRDKDGDGKLSFEEFEAGRNPKKKAD